MLGPTGDGSFTDRSAPVEDRKTQGEGEAKRLGAAGGTEDRE